MSFAAPFLRPTPGGIVLQEGETPESSAGCCPPPAETAYLKAWIFWRPPGAQTERSASYIPDIRRYSLPFYNCR